MLVLFERFATRLQGLKWPTVLGLMVMLLITAWVFTGASPELQDRWLIPAVLISVWLLLLLSGINMFARIPAMATPEMAWWARVKIRLHRGLYHLFAWFMLLVSLALVVVTFQLAAAWIRMN
ncbi:hypothetical protein [Pseudohongiella sp.]|uniref:Uncharacterized protein n=1 Tax=marine sediment metagenome TaxID=412755 RepID=A0A0F9VXQ9_9ZZZZ|nr:hypothetical protein [Pseudohongiella sp.]HDZ08635.1 hypothetical protein [Pseudohongiella sp.]HEA62251.1 hypothetical protein [Pseudohongiella sp.]